MGRKIYIFTNLIPEYREDFFRRIGSNIDLIIFASKRYPGVALPGICHHSTFTVKCVHVKKIGPLIFHMISFSDFYKLYIADADYVFDGNIRHISYLFISLILMAKGKKCFVWSSDNHKRHSFGRVFFRKIRLAYWAIFSGFLLYGKADVNSLSRELGNFQKKKYIVLGNGLGLPQHDLNSTENELEYLGQNSKLPSHYFCSIGRFYDNRFFDILPEVGKWLKGNINTFWVIVGDGVERRNFELEVIRLGLEGRVLTLGLMTSDIWQRAVIMNSRFMLHSGTVGLHVLNAYRFGKRILIPRDNSFYSIEADLCVESTGMRYEYGNLSELLDEYWSNNEVNEQMAVVVADNNTLIMAKRFFEFFKINVQI